MLRAFFGIQFVYPGRNFARFLLMSFILFSMVVRTPYQKKMVEFLQKEMYKPKAMNIDEKIDQDYLFYTKLRFRTYCNDTDFVRRLYFYLEIPFH